jgi:hypothetical protein
MSNENIFALDRSKALVLSQFVALVGIATVVPLFHQQMITGPIVNATLFAAAIILGTQMGVFVGLIPSIIALSVGTLPAPLAPMVPYIMLSNAILILAFNVFRERNYWLAVGVASLLKFAFLWATSSVVIGLLMKKELAESVALMMSWPQLLTALLGGALAAVFLRMHNGKVD